MIKQLTEATLVAELDGHLAGTIAPAMAGQYYALGVGNYHYYLTNFERKR